MKKIVLLIMIIVNSLLSFGQPSGSEKYSHGLNRIESDQECFSGMSNYSDYSFDRQITVDSLNQLPLIIQSKAEMIINKTMTGFLNNVHFIGANIFDLDSVRFQDIDFLTENYRVLPKYELHFQLCDTVLGIKSYCIDLDFDQYGQVLNYNWPTNSFDSREKFLKPRLIKKTAISFATKKKYKNKIFISELSYDKNLDKLSWYVSFFQSATYDKRGKTKKYKTIIIDINSVKHIRECGTEIFEYQIDCD